MKTIYRYNYQDPGHDTGNARQYGTIGDIPRAIWGALISAQTDRLNKVRDINKDK